MFIKHPIRLAGLVLGLLVAANAQAAWDLNMPQGVTEISRDVYDLHMLIFYVCCAIGALVFGVMFYSVFAHRRSRHPKPADFHESTTVEIVWTILPFIILIAMAIPAAGTLIKMEDMRGSDMTVKVTGYQWKWEYEYIGQDYRFFSSLLPEHNVLRQTGAVTDYKTLPADYLLEVDNRLVLPTGKKIRFLLTANDVIHAWWVPALGTKKDAIPGFVNEIWARIDEPGVYRGQCAELCGRDHGFMPVVVEAVSPDQFDAWLLAQKSGAGVTTPAASATPAPAPQQVAAAPVLSPVEGQAEVVAVTKKKIDEPVLVATDSKPRPAAAPAAEKLDQATLMAEGQKVYAQYCVACHQVNGEGLPPAFPTLKGGKVTTGPAPEQIRQVLKGKGAMQPFAGILNDRQIAAVISFERNSWGNKAGLVQPADVKAQR
ncbi:MAG: cytochrome c oxidase subunit II [Nevskiales bacterium]